MNTPPGGGGGGGTCHLVMLAYGSVRAMLLGLKFHSKAIFLGLQFANMNCFVFFFFGGGGGENFLQLPFSLSSIM